VIRLEVGSNVFILAFMHCRAEVKFVLPFLLSALILTEDQASALASTG
jgi:hypothetical protein